VLLNKYIRSELWLLYDSDWYKLLKSLGICVASIAHEHSGIVRESWLGRESG